MGRDIAVCERCGGKVIVTPRGAVSGIKGLQSPVVDLACTACEWHISVVPCYIEEG